MSTLATLAGTILFSLLGTHATYWLTHRRRMNSVRAASLTSLIFVLLAQASHWPFLLSMQAAVFGSTYVAMSEPVRLSERRVLVAGLVFGLILTGLQHIDFLHFHGGVGGTLGGTAFVACVCVYWLQWVELRFLEGADRAAPRWLTESERGLCWDRPMAIAKSNHWPSLPQFESDSLERLLTPVSPL